MKDVDVTKFRVCISLQQVNIFDPNLDGERKKYFYSSNIKAVK